MAQAGLNMMLSLSLMQKLNTLRELLNDFSELEDESAGAMGMGVIAAQYRDFALETREFFERLSAASGFFARMALKAAIFNCQKTAENMSMYDEKFRLLSSGSLPLSEASKIQQLFMAYCDQTDTYYRNALREAAKR